VLFHLFIRWPQSLPSCSFPCPICVLWQKKARAAQSTRRCS
jgi:hypothetical protein